MTTYPNIKLKPLNDTNFEVLEDCYVLDFDFTIAAGSVTDLTTGLRGLWWLIPPHGASKSASIVHDFLIRNDYERDYADCIFLFYLLKAVPKWQAYLMFWSIQNFTKIRNKIEK
jgi:hypothetical protein